MKTFPPSPSHPDIPEMPEALSSSKMMEAAKKFESYFVGFVFQKAYESVPKSELLGNQEQVFTGMFIENVADQIAKSPRGLGLADQIYHQMKHMKDEKDLSLTSPMSLHPASGREELQNITRKESGTDFAQYSLGTLSRIK